MTPKQRRERLHRIAKERLLFHPDAYLRFITQAESSMKVGDAVLLIDGLESSQTLIASIDPAYALKEFDRRAVAFIDRWATENIGQQTPIVEPIVPARFNTRSPSIKSKNETAEQRQKRRYEACLSAGLKIDVKNTYAHLPRGIGKLAKNEGISTAAFPRTFIYISSGLHTANRNVNQSSTG